MLAGEFDLGAAEAFEACLRRIESRHPQSVVLDLRDLSFIDSTGLRLILDLNSRSRENGFELGIVRGPENVHRVFEITGLGEHLPLVEDAADLADRDDHAEG